MTAKEAIADFEILILDMGDTFMFGCDRFDDANIRRTVAERHLDKSFESDIAYLYDRILNIGRQPEAYEHFPTIGEFIRSDERLKKLTARDAETLADIFAGLEIGVSARRISKR